LKAVLSLTAIDLLLRAALPWRRASVNRSIGRRPLHCGISARLMSALGHVWTAPPWQELSDIAAALVGCGHVSGLFVRR